MANLADSIEDYLKKLLTLSAAGYIEIKRKELANKFRCVPSQVNYVLETRFTLDRGYVVESKRGGKGYVRIKKIFFSRENLVSMLLQELMSKEEINGELAKSIIYRLNDGKLVSFREAKLMEAALEGVNILEDKALQDRLRNYILRNMLLLLLKAGF